jgi:hypothetical protein
MGSKEFAPPDAPVCRADSGCEAQPGAGMKVTLSVIVAIIAGTFICIGAWLAWGVG